MKRLFLAAILTPVIFAACRPAEEAKDKPAAGHAQAGQPSVQGAPVSGQLHTEGAAWTPPPYRPQQIESRRVRHSWHETIHRIIEGNPVMIVYGRPYMTDYMTGKRRSVWGGQLVPYDKIWRLGADEATLFITQQDIEIEGVTVPAGAYTLYMHLFSDNSAQLLINREIGQWGLEPPNPKKEFARVPLKRQAIPEPVDPFTIQIDNGEPSGGLLRFAWDNVEYSVPFRIKPVAQ